MHNGSLPLRAENRLHDVSVTLLVYINVNVKKQIGFDMV